MKTVLTTAVLGAAAAISVILAPNAQADPDVNGYIAALDSSGVHYPSVGKALELGMAVCSDLRQGATLVSEGHDIAQGSQGALNVHDAGVIIGASAAALCPDQNGRIQREAAG
jgi:hypothetical protein